jgi:hypothetical protein
MRWSIGFQRELRGKWFFEASYVGSHGYDLIVRLADGTNARNYVDLNGVPRQFLSTSPVRDDAVNNSLTTQVPNPFQGLIPNTGLNGATVARSQLLRPYPQFLSVRTERRGGTSNYNAAQLRLERRLTDGYTLMLGYTYSRFTEKATLLNPTDQALQEYVADSDTPHRLTVSAIWQLPFGKGRRFDLGGTGNAILGGWSVQGIYNWQSGRPINFGNVYYNGDPTALKSDYSKGPDGVFDTSGFYFSDAAVQTGGVVDPAKQRADPRIRLVNNIRTFPLRLDGVRRPAVSFFEVSAIKTIDLGRSVRLQLRVEAFNAFNTPNFDAPSVDPTSSDFAKSTAQYNIPRNVQLGAKLTF